MRRSGSSKRQCSKYALSKQLERVESQVAGLRSMLASFDPAALPDRVSADWINAVLHARRRREAIFGQRTFVDPGWDLLLHLYARELDGNETTIGTLCDCAAVPRSTGLRWVGELERAGLINRSPDLNDRRRGILRLSARAKKGMDEYFAKPEAALLVG